MTPTRLILACRSKEKGEAALAKLKKETKYPGTAELWILDLADFSSVKSFAERFEADGGRLDIFVANAAIDPNKKLEFTADGWESAVQVNNLSTSLLSLLLLPRMLETAEKYNATPRLVVVSSLVHYFAKFKTTLIDSSNPFRAYAHKEQFKPPLSKDRYNETKLLNLFFTRALNDRLNKKPVVVNSVNPGYCYSSLRRRLTGLQAFIDSLMEKALARTSEQGSRELVWAAVGGAEKQDELRGAYISLSKVDEPSDYVISKEGKAAQEKLWNNLIDELTKVDPKVQKIVAESLTAPTKAKKA
jgi:NAD(P)-dependent dehydrogenase (short-subunit alcohol dehydrogenase family)